MNNIQSPRIDDQGIEQLIKAKGMTAPRITPEDLERNIESEYYFTAHQGACQGENSLSLAAEKALSLLTFCVLVLKNGFTVTGESAPVSATNFDPRIDRDIARQNAMNKMWPLLGYELKSRLANTMTPPGENA